jgi:hypothetical protein
MYHACLENLVELCLRFVERLDSIAIIDQSMKDHIDDLMINALLMDEL